ncbi:MAG: N-acetylmuramoyl-L-alanine amidase [Candidatus Pacebacteria bacterium]|nr:N-acetylmuramoyl-L-alanine amidase [Candidatus Paceibacterota bacterium]
MKKPEYIMIHHSAVSYDRNSDQFEANNNYHKAQWDFKSSLGFYLGYNYEIAKNGKVRQARADGETTAACYQQNMNDGRCIHVCLDGHFDNEKPQPAQIFALRDLLRKLVDKYKIKKDNIIFHRDYASKSCPGSNLDIVFIRSLVNGQTEAQNDDENIKEELINILNKAIELIKRL